jgi:hypothetical protein
MQSAIIGTIYGGYWESISISDFLDGNAGYSGVYHVMNKNTIFFMKSQLFGRRSLVLTPAESKTVSCPG